MSDSTSPSQQRRQALFARKRELELRVTQLQGTANAAVVEKQSKADEFNGLVSEVKQAGDAELAARATVAVGGEIKQERKDRCRRRTDQHQAAVKELNIKRQALLEKYALKDADDKIDQGKLEQVLRECKSLHDQANTQMQAVILEKTETDRELLVINKELGALDLIDGKGTPMEVVDECVIVANPDKAAVSV